VRKNCDSSAKGRSADNIFIHSVLRRPTVTLAEALIAHTGSIPVTAAGGGRSASVIAPCHIVYARTEQIGS
jgi:hypothetical protein